jgi:hypothetical protein
MGDMRGDISTFVISVEHEIETSNIPKLRIVRNTEHVGVVSWEIEWNRVSIQLLDEQLKSDLFKLH